MVLERLIGVYSDEETEFFLKHEWKDYNEQIPDYSRGGKVFLGQEMPESLNFIPGIERSNYCFDKAFGRVDC